MEYNTTRNHLTIPEYGRNVQKMVEYILTVEKQEERTQLAYQITQVMSQVIPQSREAADHKQKLWDHLHIISNYQLDADSPFPPPTPETGSHQQKKLEYNNRPIRFRHYGYHIQKMIEKATTCEEGPEKEALVKLIANHMKKVYLTWNRETVEDEVIYDHLKILSGGKLKIDEDIKLEHSSQLITTRPYQRKRRPRPGGSTHYHSKYRPRKRNQ